MFKTLSTLTMLGLLAMPAARAQSNEPLRAQIPFTFEVRGATLPAGNYQLSYSPTSHLMTVRGAKHAAFVHMRPAFSPVASESGKLLFQCYGGACYLAAVWPRAASGEPALQATKSALSQRISFITRAVSLTAPVK